MLDFYELPRLCWEFSKSVGSVWKALDLNSTPPLACRFNTPKPKLSAIFCYLFKTWLITSSRTPPKNEVAVSRFVSHSSASSDTLIVTSFSSSKDCAILLTLWSLSTRFRTGFGPGQYTKDLSGRYKVFDFAKVPKKSVSTIEPSSTCSLICLQRLFQSLGASFDKLLLSRSFWDNFLA